MTSTHAAAWRALAERLADYASVQGCFGDFDGACIEHTDNPADWCGLCAAGRAAATLRAMAAQPQATASADDLVDAIFKCWSDAPVWISDAAHAEMVAAILARDRAMAAQQEQADAEYRRKLDCVIEIERRAYDRLALCSDHRDKATGRCIVCVAEERTRREQAAKPAAGQQDIEMHPRYRAEHERAERWMREAAEMRRQGETAVDEVWDDVLAAVQRAWPEPQSYGECPTELIARLIDERDAALATTQATPPREGR